MDHPQNQTNELIHGIDKRVVSIETLLAERNRRAEEEFKAICGEISKLREEIVSLRIRAASTAAIVATLVTLGAHFVIR